MMPLLNQFKRFDVRVMLARGVEPFPEIHQRVQALQPDEGLIVVAPFLPSPLVENWAARGLPAKWNAAAAATGSFTFGAKWSDIPP